MQRKLDRNDELQRWRWSMASDAKVVATDLPAAARRRLYFVFCIKKEI
jgi:hypothetical protein